LSATQAVDSRTPATFWLTFLYGLIIFVSAFLLFQVQPLITKIILPWFGGVAAVWTASLLFFQIVLLAGYFYAHVLTTRFSSAMQGRFHAGLVVASLLTLPILPRNSLKPTGPEAPLWHILAMLALAVGLPYFVLSATSPLLQFWYAREKTNVVPYRFYALSNLGSMLALLSYPVLVEPFVASVHQAVGWSIGYAAIALVCAGLALTVSRSRKFAMTGSLADQPPPPWETQILWLALAACGSALLLAVTNHISQDIAPVPFLWVIPLAVYLLSFILCFDRTAWYKRDLFLRLLAVALGGMAYGLDPSFSVLPMKVLIPVYCIGLWICCMFCHGELARLKPDGAHLTGFYLMSSLGGAIGAIFVALVAPAIFTGYYELPCALGFCAALVLVTQFRDPSRAFQGPPWHPAKLVLTGLMVAVVGSLAVSVAETKKQGTRSMRNFYGVLRVVDHGGVNAVSAPDAAVSQERSAARGEGVKVPAVHVPMYLSPNQTVYRQLLNGTTDHGLQFLSPSLRRRPTSYYSEKSGAGIALKTIQQRGSLQVGLVGLGAGTLAAYGRRGDHYTFYEINPLDVEIAKEEFTFLGDSFASIRIVPGDARLSLEREHPEQYDALVLDAFSSDSIPAHLLTREAFGLYFRRLKSDGVLALHISNQYLDLRPVVEAAAREIGKEAILVNNADDHPQGIYAASWILMGSQQGFYGRHEMEAAGAILHPSPNERPWTDDYSSLFHILK
jgi:lipid-A-disaccharide synthase-like uncharacterized protein